MLQRTSQLHASDWPCLSSSFGEMLVAATEAIKFSRRLWIEDCWFQTSFSWLKRVSEKWCGLVKIPGRSSASNSDCYSYSKSTDSLLQWSPFVHEVLFTLQESIRGYNKSLIVRFVPAPPPYPNNPIQELLCFLHSWIPTARRRNCFCFPTSFFSLSASFHPAFLQPFSHLCEDLTLNHPTWTLQGNTAGLHQGGPAAIGDVDGSHHSFQTHPTGIPWNYR